MMLRCLNMSEFTIKDRVLNMSHTMHSARSLYKLMNTYWEIGVFRTLSKIKECFGKLFSVLTIFAKHSILYLWESSEYVLSFKYVRVVSIPDCQYGNVLNFRDYPGFTYFRKYDRVLNMRLDTITEGLRVFQDFQHGRLQCMQGLYKVLNMSECS